MNKHLVNKLAFAIEAPVTCARNHFPLTSAIVSDVVRTWFGCGSEVVRRRFTGGSEVAHTCYRIWCRQSGKS